MKPVEGKADNYESRELKVTFTGSLKKYLIHDHDNVLLSNTKSKIPNSNRMGGPGLFVFLLYANFNRFVSVSLKNNNITRSVVTIN